MVQSIWPKQNELLIAKDKADAKTDLEIALMLQFQREIRSFFT